MDNVRDYVFTGRPWLAADATLCPSQGMTDLDIVQTGAWILSDDRPLPRSRDRRATTPERREIKKIGKSTPVEHGLPFSTWSLARTLPSRGRGRG